VPPRAAENNAARWAPGSVGDDNIQQATQGQANPDSFTHGTSAQRIQAFTLGYQAGSVSQCDPFGVTGSGSGAN
jgi:predicted metalloprotease